MKVLLQEMAMWGGLAAGALFIAAWLHGYLGMWIG